VSSKVAERPSDVEHEIITLVARAVQDSTGRAHHARPDEALIASGVLDSLSVVNLVVALHARWGIDVDPLDIDEQRFGSVRSIARYVEGKLRQTA
jgi:acyl carrier protein